MPWTTPATFTSGQILTAAQMNTNVRDNTNALYDSQKRIAQVTRNYGAGAFGSFNSPTVSGGTDVFASDISFTADGTSTYWVEFYSALLQSPTDNFANVHLTDGGNNSIQIIAVSQGSTGNADNSYIQAPVYVRVPYTPASGTRTLNVRVAVGGGTAYLYAQGGTSGEYATMYLSVYGPDMT